MFEWTILAAAAAAAAALTPQEQIYADVKALSDQLRAGRFNTQYDHGRLVTCEVTESTGDPELDATFCQVVRACPLPEGADTPQRATGECMDREQLKLLVQLAAKRRGITLRGNAG